MQVDPDESLKTKEECKRKSIDPDDCLKTEELRGDCGEAKTLVKRKELEVRSCRDRGIQ
jgi:hypothetical protein